MARQQSGINFSFGLAIDAAAFQVGEDGWEAARSAGSQRPCTVARTCGARVVHASKTPLPDVLPSRVRVNG